MQYVLHNGGLVPANEVPVEPTQDNTEQTEQTSGQTPEGPAEPVKVEAPVAPVEVKQEPKVEAPVPLLVPEVPTKL